MIMLKNCMGYNYSEDGHCVILRISMLILACMNFGILTDISLN